MPAAPFYTRHRGPYTLQLNRDTPKQKQPWHTEALEGLLSGEEALELAHSFVNDPRDTIQSVHIWSDTEECHVCTVRRTGGTTPEVAST